VIGVDFGTSSTKIAFRRLGEGTSFVAPAALASDELPWFCTPTAYSVADGLVRLGTSSQEADANLKLRLLGSSLPADEFGDEERKCIAYLGWMIEHATRAAMEHFRLDRSRVILNVGVPVALFGERERLRARFDKYQAVAQAAMATTTQGGGPGIQQAMPVAELMALVDTALASRESMGAVAIMPESSAALVSLQSDPFTEEGTYTVVDIGAGTRDVSSSRLTVSDRGRKIVCYDDSSEPKGAFELQSQLRKGHEPSALLNSWKRQWVTSWNDAQLKDRGSPRQHGCWKDTTIVMTGGGGFHPAVIPYLEKALATSNPAKIIFGKDARMAIKPYEPSPQSVSPSRGAGTQDRDAYHLLAVAHGLSYQRREWPEWYRPDDVETLTRPTPPRYLDPQEMGYSGG